MLSIHPYLSPDESSSSAPPGTTTTTILSCLRHTAAPHSPCHRRLLPAPSRAQDLESAITTSNGGANSLAREFRQLSVRKVVEMRAQMRRDVAKPGDADYAPRFTDARLGLAVEAR